MAYRNFHLDYLNGQPHKLYYLSNFKAAKFFYAMKILTPEQAKELAKNKSIIIPTNVADRLAKI